MQRSQPSPQLETLHPVPRRKPRHRNPQGPSMGKHRTWLWPWTSLGCSIWAGQFSVDIQICSFDRKAETGPKEQPKVAKEVTNRSYVRKAMGLAQGWWSWELATDATEHLGPTRAQWEAVSHFFKVWAETALDESCIWCAPARASSSRTETQAHRKRTSRFFSTLQSSC